MHRAAIVTAAGNLTLTGVAGRMALARESDPDWEQRYLLRGHPDLTGTFSSDDMRGVPFAASRGIRRPPLSDR